MARLFTSGFEANSGTGAGLTEWSVATATIESTAPRSGTYRGLYLGTGTTLFRRDLSIQITSGTLFTRAYFNVSNAARTEQFFRWQSDSGVGVIRVEKRSTGVIRLTNLINAGFAETTNTLQADTWYRIEVRHLISDTVGELELRWYLGDSTTPLDTITVGAADADTLPTNVYQIIFQGTSGFADSIRIDDVAINDATGSFQNSWPGPGHVASILQPNADVSVSFVKGGSAPEAANYLGVDDVPGVPDDDVTFNYHATNGNEDKLGLTSLEAAVPSNADLKLLDVYARVRANTTGGGTLALKVWDNNDIGTEGPSISVTSATWRMLRSDEHQVYDLDTSGYTKAQIDDFKVGYITKTGTVEKHISAVWVNVEWIEASGTSLAAAAGAYALAGIATVLRTVATTWLRYRK